MASNQVIQQLASSLPLTPLGVKMSISAEEEVYFLRAQLRSAKIKCEAAERRAFDAKMKMVALEGDNYRLKEQVKGLSSFRHIGPRFRFVNKQNKRKFHKLQKSICEHEELINRLNHGHGDLLADIKLQLDSHEVKHLEVPVERIHEDMNENNSSGDESTDEEWTLEKLTADDLTEAESSEDESSEGGSSEDESSEDESSKDGSSEDESTDGESTRGEPTKDESTEDESTKDQLAEAACRIENMQ